MEAELLKRSRVLAEKFLQFVNFSKSPFHAVEWCREQLLAAGFRELTCSKAWELKEGDKCFLTKNNSTLMAFNVGSTFSKESTGFKIVGTHTDSPCLKLAPVSKNHFKTLSTCHVTTYGGGLWHTWFDRDLTLAGKIVYMRDGVASSKLWQSNKPIMKIPNLAIHLTTERNKFQPNTQSHLKPMMASDIHKKLLAQSETAINEQIGNKHEGGLIRLICNETGITSDQIIDFDLCLSDTQPAGFFGLDEQFISSPRLDNLFSSFHGTPIWSLMHSINTGNFVNVAVMFDHEECGSQSSQGAASSFFGNTLHRIYSTLAREHEGADGFERAVANSFAISADMAHGIHPNYSDKHHSTHQVELNKGVVIKMNPNQRYASDLVSGSILKLIAQQKKVPIQEFIVRNDSPCGSTIGPIISTGTGLKTVDIGMCMLGMHSIRETCGVIDGAHYSDLFVSFYENYEKLKHNLLDN